MTDDALIGRQLANFKIERVLGQGGMARVYYGTDVKLERPVAIKVIDARYRENPDYARRFMREAQTIATWRHENIIHIYYSDDSEGLYYFVMEYLDGPDLREMITQYEKQDELLPLEEILRVAQAITNALDYAHKRGVIHRDIKPANVLSAEDGRLVLSDFGLALDVEQGSLGEVFGSSHYIAPEQAHRSADAVSQSDLYSLGVMLYELLTGQVPFNDPSPTAVALQHITTAPPNPCDINPTLSPEIEQFLLKALSKSPADRYQTGQELLEALTLVLEPELATSVRSILGPITKSAPAVAPEPEATPINQAETEPDPEPPPAKMPSVRVGPMKKADSMIGRQLDEYRLEGLLGQGGMARVYKGMDVRLNRAVAIKVIDTPFRADTDYIKRFEREAQAIAQLEHTHIVTLYRFGEADGLLYLAMQYIEGFDLSVILSNYRREHHLISPPEIARILREACLALDSAHEQGGLHRDIKSSNIMMDKKERVILTDFGLALFTDVGTQGEIFGSPHYIAPEQAISSAGVVPQSDFYSVGVILYEMVTGQLPFDAKEPLDIAMMHMTDPPPPPRQVRPDISPALEAVILKTLSKSPEDRYPNGAALADALDAALQIGQETPPEIAAKPATVVPIPTGTQPERISTAPSPMAIPTLPPAPVTETESIHPLPPVPASVVSQSQPNIPTPTSAPAPVSAEKKGETRPAPAPVTAPPSKNKQYLIFGLIGLAIITVLLIALASFLFFFWNSYSEEETANTQNPTPITQETTQPDITLADSPTPPPLPTSLPADADTVTTLNTPTLAATNADTDTNTPAPADTDTDTAPALTPPTATSPPPTPTTPPTNTPTPGPTPTDTPVPPIAESANQFSGTQKATNWEYSWSKGRTSFDWRAMRFDGTCWRINDPGTQEDPVRICQNSAHPGITGDIAWIWHSNVAGPVWVNVTARKIDTNGGDGVDIILYRGLAPVKSWTLEGNDGTGFSETVQLDITQDDLLFFVMSIRGSPDNDETAFWAQVYQ